MTLSKFAFVLNVGFISMMLLDGSMALMTACQDGPQEKPVPCFLRNPETQDVCYGQGASVNITVKLPQDIMTNLSLAQIKVLVLDQEFSHGSLVAGEHHNGKEDLQRWRIRIIFYGDTMVYEIQNKEVEYRDEFICQLELNIGGQKFRSDFLQWFAVEKCPPPTQSSMPSKEAQQLNATCKEDLLKNMREKFNALALEIEELKTMNSNLQQNVSELVKYTKKAIQRSVHSDDQLEKVLEELGSVNKNMSNHNRQTLVTNIIIFILFILTVKIFKDTSVMECLLNKFSRFTVACASESSDLPLSRSSFSSSSNDSCNWDEHLAANEGSSLARDREQSSPLGEAESLISSPSDEHTTGEPVGHQQRGQVSLQEMTSRHDQSNNETCILVQEETVDGGDDPTL